MTELALPSPAEPPAVHGGDVVTTDSPLRNVRIELVNTIEQAYAFKRWLGERRRVLGVDTESSGLKPERDVLRLVQFGDLDTGWAIPWELWGGVALEALTTYEGDLVMHNSSFDCRFLETHTGWSPPWHRVGDTMCKAHLVDPTRPKGLKPLAGRLVDARAVAGQGMLDRTMAEHGWDWGSVPVDHPHYWVYGGLDPVLTCHVDEHLDPIIKQRNYGRAYDLEMATTRICARLMLRGVRVDLDYCDARSRELRAWVLRARDWIRDAYGIDNATSNNQVIAVLQADGVQLTKRTESGDRFALDKEVLESLSHEGGAQYHPLARYVLAIRRAEKICGSYLENFSEMVGPDGYVHPNVNVMGARTGRMSVTEPALQTLHRDDPTVRRAFVASVGHAIISCDYDQIEMRLVAHFSRDPGLIEAFAADGDFFCEIASQIFGEQIAKGDKRRQITKNTSYGRLYGAGNATIARTAKVTPEVAEAFTQAFDARFPGISELSGTIINAARYRYATEGRAYVRTPVGREIPEQGSRDYALINYFIQASAAEVLKQSMVNLDAAGLGDYMVLPVHDELVLDVPTDEVDEVAATLERLMTNADDYLVPLTASVTRFGERWGLKK